MRGMLVLDDVSKSFGDTRALRSIRLSIPPHRTLALIGPSGCGKSTLLRLLIGLIAPDSGRIQFESEIISSDTVLALRRRMGYVIQDGGLFPHLTARENVSLQARYLGRSRDEVASRIHQLAELARFPLDGLDRYPVQLSGGQRQRVSLMRSLMLDPDVLLLDEPLGALDPMIRSELQVDLRRIFRSLKKTVVLVTHDLAEARYFADRIVLMLDGRIVQEGSYAELTAEPADAFVTRFINAQNTIHGGGEVAES